MSDNRQLLTQSRLSAARSCQRLHHIKYDLGYRPVREGDALRLGSLVHRALEAWWLATEHRLDASLAAIAACPSDPYEAAKAVAMMTGYDARWGQEPYEVIAVEQEFRADLINPETGRASQTWQLAGKIDAIVRDTRDVHNGRTLIVEHKTSSADVSPGSEYWRRLRMDGQISMYFVGARALGYDVQGCVYDVLSKPGLRPLQVNSRRAEPETPAEYQARLLAAIAESPDKYYSRGEVVRLDGEASESVTDMWQLAQQLREAQLAGRAPKNPDACVSWGSTCPFFDACCNVASLDDKSLFTKTTNVHSELTQTTNEAAQ